VLAQQSERMRHIGVLSPPSPAAATRNIEALQAGLRDLGPSGTPRVAAAALN
jgi:hypothetical protein